MKNEKEALKSVIIALEAARNLQIDLLRTQYLETYESFKLINIINNTFDEITASAEIKTNIIENLLGIGTGIIAKKLIKNNTNQVTQNMISVIVQFVFTKLISSQSESTKSKIEALFYSYLQYRRDSKNS